MDMQKLDIAIIILVGLATFSCFRAGFTRSVWGIVAVAAAIFMASQLWGRLAPFLDGLINNEGIAKWASIILITVVTGALMNALFERFQRVVEQGVLGWINNLIGAAFGVIVSSVLIGGALILLDRFGGETVKEAIAHSRLAPVFMDIGYKIFDFGKEMFGEQTDQI
jgi:membrane protein required for colicin V production